MGLDTYFANERVSARPECIEITTHPDSGRHSDQFRKEIIEPTIHHTRHAVPIRLQTTQMMGPRLEETERLLVVTAEGVLETKVKRVQLLRVDRKVLAAT